MTETMFLVDGHKHRIVKLDGLWKLYCPKNGTGPRSIIMASRFEDIRSALTYPCRYQVGGELMTHLVPVAWTMVSR